MNKIPNRIIDSNNLIVESSDQITHINEYFAGLSSPISFIESIFPIADAQRSGVIPGDPEVLLEDAIKAKCYAEDRHGHILESAQLSNDEAAIINLYTMNSVQVKSSFRTLMNRALTNANRNSTVKPFVKASRFSEQLYG